MLKGFNYPLTPKGKSTLNVYSRPGLIGLRELRGDGGFGVRFKASSK
jgi:hypothetical protein